MGLKWSFEGWRMIWIKESREEKKDLKAERIRRLRRSVVGLAEAETAVASCAINIPTAYGLCRFEIGDCACSLVPTTDRALCHSNLVGFLSISWDFVYWHLRVKLNRSTRYIKSDVLNIQSQPRWASQFDIICSILWYFSMCSHRTLRRKSDVIVRQQKPNKICSNGGNVAHYDNGKWISILV